MRELRLGIAFALAAALIGCNDQTPPAPPGSGGSGTGGTIIPGSGGSGGSGAGGTSGTGGGGGMAGNGGTGMGGGNGGVGGVGGVIASGACDNQSDNDALTALASLPVQNARQVAANCAITEPACISAPDPDSFTQCVRDCVISVVGVSAACATCYGELALCSGPLCNTPCANDSCALGCENASNCAGGTYADCFQALDACASRPSRDCTGDT